MTEIAENFSQLAPIKINDVNRYCCLDRLGILSSAVKGEEGERAQEIVPPESRWRSTDKRTLYFSNEPDGQTTA